MYIRLLCEKQSQNAQDKVSLGKESQQYIDEVSCKGENLYKIQEKDRNDSPYMLGIGALNFNRKGIAVFGKGTAFMISPDLALTNAHNIFDQNRGIFSTNIKFYPGIHGELLDQIEIQQYELPPEYTKSQGFKYQYDYALLKLRKRPPNIKRENIVTLGMNFNDVNAKLDIFGYPDCSYETMNKEATSFNIKLHGLSKQKRIKEINKQNNRILYEITALPGQSGSPIVTFINKKPVATGIHSGGHASKEQNLGRLISNDMMANLKKWADKMKGIPFEVIDFGENEGNFKLIWNIKSPFINHFEVNKNTIKRVPTNNQEAFEYYQIVSQRPLPKVGIHKMSFRLIQYGQSYSFITFGVIQQNRRDQQDSGGEGGKHKGSIGYQTGAYRYGSIFIDGEILANFNQQIYIPQGYIFKMEIDQDKNSVKFANSLTQKIVTLGLPQSFKGRDIFPFITMSDSGDEVQIL